MLHAQRRVGARADGEGVVSALEQFNKMDLLQAADLLSKSNLVPKAYRGKAADIVVARLWGEEAGIGMFAALQYLDVIDGNPTVNADGCNALIRRAGHSLWFEMSSEKCVAHGKRADTGDEMTVTWTMQMASQAGLANKQVWKQYAADMLKSRATTQIARALFADVLMGVKYTAEEAASFAEPELLDATPDALAARTMGVEQPALPAAPETPQVIDVQDTQGYTSAPKPRTFAPPQQRKTTAQLDAEAKALLDKEPEFNEADQTLCSADELKALRDEIDALDLEAASEVADAWKAAGLPSVKNKKHYDKAAYEKAMELVLTAREAMEVRIAAAVKAEAFFEGEEAAAS